MAKTPRILAFSGSLREGSFNTKLARIAAGGARAAGANVTELDLRDLPMPVYGGDIEAADGLPENAGKLKAMLKDHDGFIIGSPEHNGGYSTALKNAIDWASRPAENEAPLECFRGKVAAIMSASPGGLGGLRGLAQLRALLEGIYVMVLPEQRAISGASQAFDGNGRLEDEGQHEAIEQLGTRLAEILARLKS